MKKFAVKVACLFNIYTFFKGTSHLQRKRCKVSLIQKTLTIKAVSAHFGLSLSYVTHTGKKGPHLPFCRFFLNLKSNNTKNLERHLANQGFFA